MIVRDKVSVTVKSQYGKAFCDKCLQSLLPDVSPPQLNTAARELSRRRKSVEPAFTREKGVCDGCGLLRRQILRATS